MTRLAPRLASHEWPTRTYLRSAPVIERLMFRTAAVPSGCWEWRGWVGPHGYGTIAADGSGPTLRAHRVSYEYFIGPIPEGFQLDHLCHNTRCVNPEHLEAVTAEVNCERRRRQNQHDGKPACLRGHAFTVENAAIDRSGHRRCRTCRRLRDAERVKAERESKAAS
jgi:hypothetical protein